MNNFRQHARPIAKEQQGKSKEDRELDHTVGQVQSKKVKVMLAKKMQANLDSLDHDGKDMTNPIQPIASKDNHSGGQEGKRNVISAIDNVLAVVKSRK